MAKKEPNYAYTIQPGTDPTLADQSGDRFKYAPGTELIVANQPDRKSMRYIGKGEEENFDITNAGAGRGKRGGPSAKEVEGKKKGGSVKGWGKARGARKAKIY